MPNFLRNLMTPMILAVLGAGLGCGHTVEPGQVGMKYHALQKPGLETELRDEGFYFQWGWNDVVVYDTTWKSADETIAVLTADDLHVPLVVTVIYRPQKDRLYELHTLIGKNYYKEVIRPSFTTIVRAEFSKYKHNDLARMSPDLERSVHAQLVNMLASKPLDIDHVAIKHIEFDVNVTRAISAKLTKEQEAEQKVFELRIAEQDAEITRTQTRGYADAVRIQAAGDAEAIVVKGKAQAEAQGAVTQTLTKEYLQYKAFDGDATTYYFVPVGEDGLPIIVNTPHTPRRLRKQ